MFWYVCCLGGILRIGVEVYGRFCVYVSSDKLFNYFTLKEVVIGSTAY